MKIYPSILAADIGHLHDACVLCEQAGADGIHVDVMDGVFVPNVSFGPEVVRMAKAAVSLPLNVHLMMIHPDQYVDPFCDGGAETLLIHVEADCEIRATLRSIRDKGVRAGITLNPDTSIDAILPYMDLVDEVLFMTVFPGFGGQAFIPEPLEGMRRLRARYPDVPIAVDGGLNRDTCMQAAKHGANVFDIGSSLFNVPDMAAEIAWLRENLV